MNYPTKFSSLCTHIAAKELAVAEDPEEVGDEEYYASGPRATPICLPAIHHIGIEVEVFLRALEKDGTLSHGIQHQGVPCLARRTTEQSQESYPEGLEVGMAIKGALELHIGEEEDTQDRKHVQKQK